MKKESLWNGKTVLLDSITINPRNPRTMDKEAFEQLRKSVRDFPKMLEIRPIVIDAKRVIIGGTQRYRALVANGMTEVPAKWVKLASDLTPAERKRFIVIDNSPDGMSGENDWDILGADYEAEELIEWGFDAGELGMDPPEPQKAEPASAVKTKCVCRKCGNEHDKAAT